MYWLPKLHKTPSKAKFIVATHCTLKSLSKAGTPGLKSLCTEIESYHAKY